MPKKPLIDEDGEVRTPTKEEFARAVRMADFDPDFLHRFEEVKRQRGRPAGRSKKAVTLSLDLDLIEKLRATGSGWQSRVNALLRAAVGLSESSTT